MFLIEVILVVLIGVVMVLYLDNDVKSVKWFFDEEKVSL